jgi:integrase
VIVIIDTNELSSTRLPYDVNTPIQDVNLARALMLYSESLSDTNQGLRYAEMFCHTATDTSKGSLDQFMEEVRTHYKDSTVRYIFNVLKRMYKIAGLKWPYRSADTPVVRERTVFAPMLDPDIIQEMIHAAKVQLPSRIAFYLAISTVYGCRRAELAQLDKPDIDLKERLIYIETKKSGRERYHLIPDEVYPFVERGRKLIHPMTTKTMDRMWRRIENAIQFPHVKGVGWHSVRRTLDKMLLEQNLPISTVMDFLRWKRSERDMAYRYAQGTVIGRDTVEHDITIRDRAVDEKVFEVHPFLPLWNITPASK